MEAEDGQLERVLRTLQECRGVIAVKILSDEEKKGILNVEGAVEEKIILGMCKSLNKGLRDALQKEFAAAMVIQTEKFQYPHHPEMVMVSEDQIIGEQVYDKNKLEELRRNPTNLFLWENFVVYMKNLPRDPKKRSEMRVVYLPRKLVQLKELPYVEDSVFGVPSTEGDSLIKRMLAVTSEEAVLGTCLIGFSIKK